MIETRALTKTFAHRNNQVTALREVSVSLAEGELAVALGPSGSGKSTLLNLIGGLDRPTSGTLRVNSTDLASLDHDGMALFRREHVGFLFQAFHLLPTFTVFENAMMPLVPLRLPPHEAKERVDQALERVGIAHRADHLPGEMSGGEQQRAALARALVNSPHVLLADEPTGELDQVTGEAIIKLLEELSSGSGITVLLASHDPRFRERGHRLLTLEDGALVEDTGGARGGAVRTEPHPQEATRE